MCDSHLLISIEGQIKCCIHVMYKHIVRPGGNSVKRISIWLCISPTGKKGIQ